MPSSPTLMRLDSTNTTLLVWHDTDNLPQLAWLGTKLKTGTQAEAIAHTQNTALAYASVDQFSPLTLFPESSSGFMGSVALSGHRTATQFAHKMALQTAHQENNQITIVLQDKQAALQVELFITLNPETDVATFSTKLTNTGSTDFTVDWLASATLPLPSQHTQCISHHGRWGLENQALHRAIGSGLLDIRNWHGRTSHEHLPNLITAEATLTENSGDALFAHFGWSGNYSLRVEQLSTGTSYLQAGVLYYPGECVLKPNGSVHTPELSVTRGDGLNCCTQRFHRHARRAILPTWTRSPRPVHANSWEALYFNHDMNTLFELVDAAERIGAERFILDDGWFPKRRHDRAGLGDWTVDETIYPNGLTPLVEHIRSKGMQFGLWFEPEMVNPDSDLYRSHPEWALHVNGINTPLARDQLVLDIALSEVQDYLFNCITTLVERYAIDYIKWDMNRDLVLPGNGQVARAAEQPKALYRLMQRILDACPTLEIETCASGGARADFGVLKTTGRVWTSDNIDPIDRAKIQQGFARFYPPEIMGAHVGHAHAHLTGRATDLHTRAIIAMQGQFGFELDARKLNAEDIDVLRHYTQLYKQHRSWLNQATYWQLPTYNNHLLASGLVSEDTSQGLFNVITLDSLQHTRPGYLRLNGLNKDTEYNVAIVSCNIEALAKYNRHMPPWCTKTTTISGSLLQHIGLPLPVLPAQTALLIHCTAQSNS